MRSLLALSIFVVVGCSNACPAPVLCSEPHPDYCPCLIADTGPVVRPDAFVDPEDAHVEPTDDAAVDAAPESDAGAAVDASHDVGSDNG